MGIKKQLLSELSQGPYLPTSLPSLLLYQDRPQKKVDSDECITICEEDNDRI
jgi:hypothetical protein